MEDQHAAVVRLARGLPGPKRPRREAADPKALAPGLRPEPKLAARLQILAEEFLLVADARDDRVRIAAECFEERIAVRGAIAVDRRVPYNAELVIPVSDHRELPLMVEQRIERSHHHHIEI